MQLEAKILSAVLLYHANTLGELTCFINSQSFLISSQLDDLVHLKIRMFWRVKGQKEKGHL